MSAAGIIFSNLHDRNISELTRIRTLASVPFACRYRFIDFPLSNMVNSDITNINVIAHYNYHSLMDHIGSGKDWDLARRTGGIKILPPYITAYANTANTLYNSRLEALKSVHYSISHIPEEYVVLADCDAICNLDINDVINDHIKNGADITMVVKNVFLTQETSRNNIIIQSGSNGEITDLFINPTNMSGYHNVNINIWVMKSRFLNEVILNAIAHNHNSFNRDIIMKNIGRMNLRIYKFEGYLAFINSFTEYFSHSMDIINSRANREALFNVSGRPILTKVRNSAPTSYNRTAMAKNSLIADGCTIYGHVENSILFRGVKIGKNAVVKNCILFQDTIIGENANLNCVVSDKNSIIRDGRILSGHETRPFYIDKGLMI